MIILKPGKNSIFEVFRVLFIYFVYARERDDYKPIIRGFHYGLHINTTDDFFFDCFYLMLNCSSFH
jgi:hypothetical protein